MPRSQREKIMTTNIVKIAQDLQVKREDWKAKLEELPMPKAGDVKFPYGSLEAAIADNFSLLANGEKIDGAERAFRLLVKGYKTEQWRKLADTNREVRDEIADGEIPESIKPKRVRKKKAEAIEAPQVETTQA
jgi:hypothetical protein